MISCESGSIDFLLIQLQRVDLLLQKYIIEHQGDFDDAGLPGLVIKKQEIDRLFNNSDMSIGISELQKIEELRGATEEITGIIEEQRTRAMLDGIELRLLRVEKLFGLNESEMDILLTVLAPEIEQRYEKIYGFIQDDITKKYPTVFFLLTLFFSVSADCLKARSLFSKSSPLLFHKLIELHDDPGRPVTAMPAKSVTVDARIASYLAGSDDIDPKIEKTAALICPEAKLDNLILPSSIRTTIEDLASDASKKKVIYLYGKAGTGKRTIGESLIRQWGYNMLYVASPTAENKEETARFIRYLCREALLSGAVILVHSFNTADADLIESIIQWMTEYHCTLIVCGEKEWEPGNLFSGEDFVGIHIASLSSDDRYRMWNKFLNGYSPVDRDALLKYLAATFRINGNQIRHAVSAAIRSACSRDADTTVVSSYDLIAACRHHSSPFLCKHARKVTTRFRWDDIVLPDEKVMQLKDLCSSTRYQSVVFEEWGYGEKLSLGKGTHALFAGPSGTGKTMAAEIIAEELGLELFKIDLSSIVSKYIGETEKNLSLIFDEAEDCNVILFFDEADALMGKRSEVKDAHDRYANIEISYLLQRMEEFSGMSLLATNLRKNIDDAFIRRIRYVVEFPFPDRNYRKQIWMRIWPPRAPLSPDIDFTFLAHQFELSGGNIRNIAVNASVMAATGNECISMFHILTAVKREFQKMGKVFLNENFGRYRELLIRAPEPAEAV